MAYIEADKDAKFKKIVLSRLKYKEDEETYAIHT